MPALAFRNAGALYFLKPILLEGVLDFEAYFSSIYTMFKVRLKFFQYSLHVNDSMLYQCIFILDFSAK